MPTFLATSPDGRKFRITAPEGATKEQLEAYAQKNLPAAPEQPAAPQSKLDILKQFWAEQKPGLGPLGLAKGAQELIGRLPGMIKTSLPPSSEKGFVPTDPQKDQARIGATTDLAALGIGGGWAPTRMVTPKVAAPSTEALKTAAKGDYEVLDKSGLIKKESVEGLHKGISDHLEDRAFFDFIAPKTRRVVDKLKSDGDVRFNQIEAVRQALGHISKDPSEAAAAGTARQMIDQYLAHLPESDVKAGNPKEVSETLQRARGNYGAAARSEIVQKAGRKAESQAGGTGSGANINNAMRQRVRELLNKVEDGKLRGFSAEEVQAMRDIVKGSPTANAARWLGKFAPTGVVSAMPALGAKLAGGDLAGLGVAGAGFAGKSLGDYMTRRGLQNLDELVRSRSPLAGPRPQPQPAEIDKYLRKFYPGGALRAVLGEQNQ